jgi:hypothetical protein
MFARIEGATWEAAGRAGVSVAATAVWLSLGATLWPHPSELALAVALGVGCAVERRGPITASRVGWLAATAACGWIASQLGLSAAIGGGASWGLSTAYARAHEKEESLRLELAAQTVLTGAAGAALALFAICFLRSVSAPQPAWLWSAAIGAVTAAGALTSWLPTRLATPSTPPTLREIRRRLSPAYQAPAIAALERYGAIARRVPATEPPSPIGEIARWVVRLQLTAEALDRAIGAIPVEATRGRIASLSGRSDDDPAERARRTATLGHLVRLLEHRDAMCAERRRTQSLVEFALAALDECDASATLGAPLPSDRTPDRIPEVLAQLRAFTADRDARRRAWHEVVALG